MKEGILVLSIRKKKTIKEYYEKLFANKLDQLDGVDKFVERHKLQKLSHKK